jgi:UDP-N-acetylmuramoyl-tripeptide--D-alanyl-D-alanine ligase
MKKTLEKILAFIAKAILKKYKPTIIGITGSAGKTSAKEAIAAALAGSFDLRAPIKNYNNALGLPLTIIGGKSAGKNPLGWLGVIWRGLTLIVFPCRYPKLLVLEMGADRVGDIAKLVEIAPPDIAVVTSIGLAHIEHFGSIGAIAEEKETLVRALKPDGFAVLSADDPRVFAMRAKAPGRVLTYGLSLTADVHCGAIEYERDPRSLAVLGMRLKVADSSGEYAIDLRGVAGRGHVQAALAALAVAKILKVPFSEAAQGVRNYAPPPSRLKLVPGIKGTVLIDDTYNASPSAVFEALEVLKDFPVPDRSRRIVMLADMLELGSITEKEHAMIGDKIAKDGLDYFLAVGEAVHYAVASAKLAGMGEDRIFHFNDSVSAARFLQERLKLGDVVLIKGSQGLRMERAVVELMAEPLDAEKLVCRQNPEWLAKA